MRGERGGEAVERIAPAVGAGVAVVAGGRARQRFAIGDAVRGQGRIANAVGRGEGVGGRSAAVTAWPAARRRALPRGDRSMTSPARATRAKASRSVAAGS